MNKRLFWLLLPFLLQMVTATADTIFLANEDRLSGKVDSISSGQILLKTNYAGTLSINVDSVKRVETDEELVFKMTDGERISGRLTKRDSVLSLIDASGNTRPIILANIVSAVRETKRTIAAPMLRSRLDLSAAIATGNSDTLAANALFESTLKRLKSAHDLSLFVSREEANNLKTKDQIDADYGYKHFVSERWFASGQVEYFRDPLKNIKRQINLGAGLGFQAWDHSLSALSMEAGVSAVLEKLTESQQNPAFRWGLDYTQYLWGKQLEFFHKHSLLVIADGARGQVIDASTGLRLALTDRLDTHFRIDHQIDTKPPPEVDKIDTTYSLGIGIKFQ